MSKIVRHQALDTTLTLNADETKALLKLLRLTVGTGEVSMRDHMPYEEQVLLLALLNGIRGG